MNTLDLKEAAVWLHCHPEELRRRAKAGQVPGTKVGRAWAVSGGSTSTPPTESEYANLLKLPTKPKRKSFTTG